LRAVLFDLGDTLVKTAPVGEILARILAAHGIQSCLSESDSAYREVNGQLTFEDYTLPYRKFWRLYNMKILRRLGIRGDLEELADMVTDEWWENAGLELYPDVEETLVRLKEMGLKIGMVTNGYRKDIEEILSRTGLTREFDVTVGADDVGKPKPSKDIFRYALEKIGVSPQEALFVGDNVKTDYEGAEKAGLKALLIDRNNQVSGEVKRIQDLRELTQYF